MTYFSEKVLGSRLWYNTCDVEFYAVVQAMKHWHNYFTKNSSTPIMML